MSISLGSTLLSAALPICPEELVAQGCTWCMTFEGRPMNTPRFGIIRKQGMRHIQRSNAGTYTMPVQWSVLFPIKEPPALRFRFTAPGAAPAPPALRRRGARGARAEREALLRRDGDRAAARRRRPWPSAEHAERRTRGMEKSEIEMAVACFRGGHRDVALYCDVCQYCFLRL